MSRRKTGRLFRTVVLLLMLFLAGGVLFTAFSEDGILTQSTRTSGSGDSTMEVTGKKVWKDDGDKMGLRPKNPEDVPIILCLNDKRNSEYPITWVVDTGDTWEFKFSGLPERDDNGDIIKYSVEEDLVKYYASSIDPATMTITNTLEKTEVAGEKVWEDDGNKAGKRPEPEKLPIVLYADNKATDYKPEWGDTTGDRWSFTFRDLPKWNDKGEEITYTVGEGTVEHYNSSVEGMTITNRLVPIETPTPEPTATATPEPTATSTPDPTATPEPTATSTPDPTATPEPTATATLEPTPEPVVTPAPTPIPMTRVAGVKVWDDNGNAAGVRPESIQITLYANGNATAYAPEWGDRTGDRWSFAFNRLPLLDNEGQEIRYTLAEEPVEYYDSSIEGTTITNRLVPPEASYISVNGVKTWNDQNDARGLRPQSIVVRLLQDGAVIQEQTVTGENGWSYQFEQLPESDGYGHTYVYSVSEQMVQGYYAQVDGYNITNTILPVQEGGDDHAKSPARRVPPFEKHTEEELEDFIDIFDYDVPLWGGLLSTGDETPAYPYIFAGIGIAALCVLCIFGRRRKQPKQ